MANDRQFVERRTGPGLPITALGWKSRPPPRFLVLRTPSGRADLSGIQIEAISPKCFTGWPGWCDGATFRGATNPFRESLAVIRDGNSGARARRDSSCLCRCGD